MTYPWLPTSPRTCWYHPAAALHEDPFLDGLKEGRGGQKSANQHNIMNKKRAHRVVHKDVPTGGTQCGRNLLFLNAHLPDRQSIQKGLD